ncbi:MAG: DUF2070 family protein, partial [Methanobacteriota archaeon]
MKAVEPVSTQHHMEKTARISNAIFRAPPMAPTIAATVLLSGLVGLAVAPTPDGVLLGVELLGVPAVVAGLLSAAAANALGGTFYLRRSVFLAGLQTVAAGAAIALARPLEAGLGVGF